MSETTTKILLILLGVGILWFISGGTSKVEEGVFITPPTLEKPSEVYGEAPSFWDFLKKPSVKSDSVSKKQLETEIKQAKLKADEIEYNLEKIKEKEDASIYKDKIEISRNYGSRSDINEEYIKLKVNNLNGKKINISTWRLKSVMTGTEVLLGNGIRLPYTSRKNYKEAIFVSGGEDVIIITGRSPIGYSFQVNKCSGYLEQFQDFEPRLSKNCPQVEDENLPFTGPNSFNDDCWDYIDDISQCETPLEYPIDMQSECRNYLVKNTNHNACIDNYKDKPNFYKSEWRIFLNRNQELWKKDREIIELRDEFGKLVDSYDY